ncbi:vascular cell adhesion protein 1b isoform X2 [Clarias gariepinus]|uniref:vascular cell adhesion protein 1b isoform X2 n=1 Tax=Clarias gariepinus TaxID=13013 RepID=UPI00234DF148|nr:vascular cell adhesion protein 1b isoform X2 [Clarias gariepinus]
MIPVLRVTLTIFLQLIICHSGVSPFKVMVSQKTPLFRVGDRQELTCQVSECSGEVTFSWSSLEDKPLYAETQHFTSSSTLLFKNVNKKHENKIRCTATCKGTRGQAAATVKVYSFANNPVISGHNNLESGKENTLTCEVSDVYPAERMTLEWVRGGEVVQTENREYDKESIQSFYKFTPEITNNGESITCRATLSLEGLPQTESTRETTESMTVLCPPVNTVIFVSPNNLKEMEFLNISCVSDSSPVGHMVLSKVLDGKETELVSGDGPQVSVSYREANVSHSGFYICTTTTSCSRKTDNITVTVTAHPVEVSLRPDKILIPVQRGSSMELTCISSACPHPRITWPNLKHQPRLSRSDNQTVESQLGPWIVGLEDNQTFICEVECGSVVKSKRTELRVFSFANNPVISGHNNLESGKENTLTCEVSDVYPAERMTLKWVRGGEVVQTENGEYGKGSIQSFYKFTPEITNNGESITCRATLSLEGLPQTESTRETTESMTVLCPPVNTVISVSPNNPKEMEFLNISCVSDSSPVGHMVLSKVLDGKETELVSGDGPQVSVSYREANVSHSGFYICTTTTSCSRKTDNITITVTAHPVEVSLRPDKILIPVQRGSSMELTCISSACPHPRITWPNVKHQPRLSRSDNQTVESQLGPWIVGLEDNQTFICEVECGSVVKSKRTELRVFSFANSPVISGHNNLESGAKSILTCEVSDVYPAERMTLKWVRGGEVVQTENGEYGKESIQSHYEFTPNITNNNESITCRATLRLEGLPPTESTRNTTVSMTVLSPPRNITVAVLPSKEVQEGENITISCQSVSFPPSNITLRKLNNGNEIYSSNGTFQLVNLTSNDTGLYQVIATNVVGSETENFTLNVMSKRKNHKEIYKAMFEKLTSTDFIIPAIGVGVLAMVISSLGLIRKAKMKGAYELSEIKAELP